MAVARSLKGVSHSRPFFAHLVYSANPFVPDARSETEEAIKPRRPLFVPWNGGRLASPHSSARSPCRSSVGSPFAFSLLPRSCMSRHLPRGFQNRTTRAEKTGRLVRVEFLLRLYSLVETDNLALAGNILALPRERVAPRKAGRCKVSRVVAILEKPPHSSAESGMTASTRCNSIINEAGEQCTQFLPRSWAGVVKNRPFVLGECRLFPKERFLRPRPPIFVFLLCMTCITANQRHIARAFLLSQK